MKLTTFVVTLFACWGVLAQKPITVEISGNVFNTNKADSVFIGQSLTQGGYKNFFGTKIDKKGNYVLKGTLPSKDYYVFRVGTQHINIILRDSSKLKINADGKNLAAFNNIMGSDESVALNEFVTQMTLYNAQRDSAAAYLKRYPDQEVSINQSLQQEYMKFTSFRQRFIAQNPNSPALLPAVSTFDLDKEFATYESVVKQLNLVFKGCPTIDATYAQYLQLKKQKDASALLASGKPAPNFTQNDVNDKPVSLSDLKGKVVLIDFWASWCGPCRKENPNVVKLYNKYKDAGFTVLSVSLDDNKANWLAAIEKDKLVWPYHVSDLKKWANEVARIYQVSGIPFTVLVDKEGNIIDTKLRGIELEQALKTIFGF
ncbi:MAG TPA: TlpA disulfide reductase family protein [Fluviicola sp.]|nr:TlpA disulfide reductase family protein [Fluviicola sp.]